MLHRDFTENKIVIQIITKNTEYFNFLKVHAQATRKNYHLKGAIFFPFKQKDFPLRKEIFSLILKAFLKEPSRYFFVSQQWKQHNNV